jgi:hypothetical protein
MSLRKDVESWITSQATDKVADYATRGRKHQQLTDDELLNQWQVAFRHMADDVRDYDRRAAEDDFKAEFVLRKKEPPYDLVRDDFERYIAETDRAIAELKADDPAQFEEMTRGVNKDLEDFRSFRNKPKN